MIIQKSHLTHPKYRKDIDGLRAVAVLAVVAFHAFPNVIKGGFIGVDVFFVISGFLISTIVFENLDRGTFTFREFYARRIRRIFPALILVLLVCLLFGFLCLLSDELNQLGKHVAGGAVFVSNLLLWSESGYFDNVAETKPLLHLWSLGIEEQFYIFWPLILWLAWRLKTSYIYIIVTLCFVSFMLNINGIKHNAVASFYSPQTRFWELLFGSLLAWLSLYKKKVFTKKTHETLILLFGRSGTHIFGNVLSNAISITGCIFLFFGFCMINKEVKFPGFWALLPVLCAVLIIAAGPNTWINQKILSNKITVWFGLISFPLYLWHWPILSFNRIIYNNTLPTIFKLMGMALSILLAWLTVILVEKPFRFGNTRVGVKIGTLCFLAFVIGGMGYIISRANLSEILLYKNLVIKRNGVHAVGSSLSWYRGKDDWLFLGNAFNDNLSKLELAVAPKQSEIDSTHEIFSKICSTARKYGTEVVLVIGPNKESMYKEFLPDEIKLSSVKYSSFFIKNLEGIKNLIIYDPTNDLIKLKKSEGILYWMTDTHWNYKGAFLAYSGFSKKLGLPIPKVEFQHISTHTGDLLELSKLHDFPLHSEDNWDIIWERKPIITERQIKDEQKTSFGSSSIVINQNPLSNKSVWVVGDSFAAPLKPYFNSTFKEVRYIGHWQDKLQILPDELMKAGKKPDIIVIVRVERSF